MSKLMCLGPPGDTKNQVLIGPRLVLVKQNFATAIFNTFDALSFLEPVCSRASTVASLWRWLKKAWNGVLMNNFAILPSNLSFTV